MPLAFLFPAEQLFADTVALVMGMIAAGIGIFLCIYMSGILRAYRLLVMNEENRKKGREDVMKKIGIGVVVILIFLLCGCQKKEQADTADYKNDFAKAQEITVISADTSQIIKTITDKAEIDDFVLALEIENWKFASLPDNVSKIGSFDFSQEQTIQFGQTNPDRTLSHLATITLYDSSFIGLKFLALDTTFKVSANTAEYLRGYFG